MDNMDKETQETFDRLEREIWGEDKDLSDILSDDVLKDLDVLLKEEEPKEAPAEVKAEEVLPEEEEEEDDDIGDKDGLTVGLLITACALCVGIIGVMIYWLENFL